MIEIHVPDAFVLAAYGLTALLVGGYGLTILLRRREVEKRIAARTAGEQSEPEAQRAGRNAG